MGPRHLERLTGHDPDERPPGRPKCRESRHVVLDDDVGIDFIDDGSELGICVLRAVHEAAPDGLDKGRYLLVGPLAELRGRLADEVDPELTRSGLLFWRGSHRDEALLDAEGLDLAGPGFLGRKDDAMSHADELCTDADAVVSRSVGALSGEQHGKGSIGHGASEVSRRSGLAGSCPAGLVQ